MNLETRRADPALALDEASLPALFLCFLRIGVVSFGGSSRALMHREAVERRRWLLEPDFLTGFAIAQVLPGANPVNLALYIGLRVRGFLGAAAAVFGMILPAFVIIMLMGFAYRELARYPATHFVLDGVAAAGVAATLAVGLKVAKRLDRNVWTILLGVGVFATVGVLHWPMIPVVAVAIPLGVGFAYVEGRKQRV